MFLIDVFEAIQERSKTDKKIKLILIGEGSLEQSIKESIQEKGLEESVLFLGKRADIAELLYSMDLMVFPSLFEGLGRVPIEAQAVGTPCLLSEKTIPTEVDVIPDIILRADLDAKPDIWAQKAWLLLEQKRLPIQDALQDLKESEFNIENNAKIMFAFYEEHMLASLPRSVRED